MKSAKTVRLGDVCEVVRGVRVTRKDLASDGKYPVYQNSLKPLGMYSAYNCDGNNPFMIMALAAGEVAWSKSPFWAADDCTYFTNLKSINSRYLYYTLQAKKQELLRHVKQTTIPRLSNKYLENLDIPLPPLSEQKAIVARLDEALARATRLAEHFTTIAKNADLSFKATLAEIFENVSGKEVRLGDVCEIIAGQSPESTNYTSDSAFTEFHQGAKAFGDKVLTHSGVFTRLETKIAPSGAILMSVRAPVGTLNLTDRRICIGRGLAALVPSKSIDRVFLYLYLLSARVSIENAAGAGSVFPSISTKTLASLSLPLPPLSEQKAIAARLDAARARSEGIAEQARRGAAAVENLKKALLKEAFE